MRIYIARDKNGGLYLHPSKPERCEEHFSCEDGESFFVVGNGAIRYKIRLDGDLYPQITWENSPIGVEVVIKDEDGF